MCVGLYDLPEIPPAIWAEVGESCVVRPQPFWGVFTLPSTLIPKHYNGEPAGRTCLLLALPCSLCLDLSSHYDLGCLVIGFYCFATSE